MVTVAGEPFPTEIIFSSKHYMPKEITQQIAFLEKYPEYDGRNTIIAIVDGGVDPSCPGLQKTSTGLQKLIECMDLTGAGDVETSTIKKMDENRILIGLTERELKIPKSWKNPSGEWHLGTKIIHEMYSKTVIDRINSSLNQEFKKKNKASIAEVLKELNEHEKKFRTKTPKISEKEDRDEINAKLELLKEAEKLSIESPIADCIVWNDGQKWKACLDLSFCGDLETAKVMSSFGENYEYGFLSEKCLLSYCFNIYEDGNLLEICVPNTSHGTHVAHIAAGYFENDPEKDGLAPGAQIISLCIGDSRERNAFSSQAFIRAINKCIELKVDAINFSYGAPPSCVDPGGKLEPLIKTAVEKYSTIFVAAAGNDGPGLSMAGFDRGKNHSSIFYVGAYLTSEMKEVMYSHHRKDEPVIFPFSSRGPCLDGSLGITFCAPGAAIAGVSKHDLKSSHLKNGTSMSSPNAVGNIACLISGMKAEGIPISPFRIRLALMNSAKMSEDGSHHPYSLGAGIIQICAAFDLLKSSMTSIPVNLTDIKVSVGDKRGVYLRESYEIDSPSEFAVTVQPKFLEASEDSEAQVNFGCPIVLSLSHGSEDIVRYPKYCAIPSYVFDIHIDPTKLESGKVHFAEIAGINPNNPSLGPLFRIPITVIIPEAVSSESEYSYKKEYILEPANPLRIFLQSPYSCKYAAIKVKSYETHEIHLRFQRLFLQGKNYCSQVSHKKALPPKSEIFFHFNCPENQTIEFCAIQEWYNLNPTKIRITIKFFGLFAVPEALFSSDPTNKIFLTNYLAKTVIEPVLEFKHFCQSLSPSEICVEAMKGKRDLIDGNSSFRLLLTYKFSAPKSELYKFNHDGTQHYSKYFDSYLLQVSTASKKHIFTCGHIGTTAKLEKGDYIIRVQLRHSDPTILEKLKDARLIATQTLIPAITVDLYSDAQSTLKNSGTKLEKMNLKCGENSALFVAAVPSYKLPYTYTAGSFLQGRISLHSKEAYQSKEHSSFNVIYILAPPKSYLTDTKGKLEVEAEKDFEKEDFKTSLRDLQISYITKETDPTKAMALFEKLSSKFPNHLPIYSAEIQRLSKLKNLNEMRKIVEKFLEISEHKKVAEFFGVKSEFIEENLRQKEKMEKKKAAIINALFLYANLVLDEFLKNIEDEIPNAFRNGFDPREKETTKNGKVEEDQRQITENETRAHFAFVSVSCSTSILTKAAGTKQKRYQNEPVEREEETKKAEIFSDTESNDHQIYELIKDNNETTENENDNDKVQLLSASSDESIVKIVADETHLHTTKSKCSISCKTCIQNGITADSADAEKVSANSADAENKSAKVTKEETEKAFRGYMLFADPATENSRIILSKYAVAQRRFGTALSELKKIITDKTTAVDYLSTEKAIIQLLKILEWTHLAEEAQKTLLIKHQKSYRLL